MPHISVKCCPKHLTERQLDDFVRDMTDLVVRHLGVTEDNVSIDYNEIRPEDWKELYDSEIKPGLETLVKKPRYEM